MYALGVAYVACALALAGASAPGCPGCQGRDRDPWIQAKQAWAVADNTMTRYVELEAEEIVKDRDAGNIAGANDRGLKLAELVARWDGISLDVDAAVAANDLGDFDRALNRGLALINDPMNRILERIGR